MSLLIKAENTMAYFKAGLFGFQGTGKTYTASLFAAGICNAIDNKTIAFFDTETGSDFLISRFREQGIELFQVKSRAFSDLVDTIKESEKENIGVLIIDSITHVWRELCDSYDKKLNRNGRLQFQDWAKIKSEWQRYTDAFVNSNLHIIVCGRAGYDYDYDFNADGSKDLVKTGTKMKAEGEFSFEPSLIIEMHRLSENSEALEAIKKKRNARYAKQGFAPKIGSKWIHRAHVLKDRTDTLNGQSFDYPTFDDLRPHFEALNIGGNHLGVDTTRTSQDRFDETGNGQWRQRQDRKKIALEEIQGVMVKVWPGTDKQSKTEKADFLDLVFATRSWTAVEKLSVEELEEAASTGRRFEKLYPVDGVSLDEAWGAAVQQGKPDDIPL